MSDRPRLVPNINKPIINISTTSSSWTGPATNIQGMPGIAYDITWTGTPTGTFSVQVSNSYAQDPEANVISAGSWNTLPSGSFVGTLPAPAGSPSNGAIEVFGTGFAWIRLIYTASSGSGAFVVLASGKVW